MRGQETGDVYEVRDQRVGDHRRGDNGMLELPKKLEEEVCPLSKTSSVPHLLVQNSCRWYLTLNEILVNWYPQISSLDRVAKHWPIPSWAGTFYITATKSLVTSSIRGFCG